MASTEQAMRCYRHPGNETAVSCSNCERPICTDCMVFTSVGIKCPECAGQPQGVKRATARARLAAGDGTGLIITKSLIAVNVAFFVLELAQGGATNAVNSEFFRNGALYGPSIADGDWYRLVTSGFLHVSLIHLGFNMLMLWWFGGPLEALLGRGRFLIVYGISLLAGAAGALVLSPESLTAGASGAVFGILGAGLVLERRGIAVFGGAALGVVLLNLALSFVIANISIGGHLGGLAGGVLTILALMHFTRGHAAYSRIDAVTVVGLAAIVAASLLVVYLRVRGYA
jgi:membrane associated rhomboid family serine protease